MSWPTVRSVGSLLPADLLQRVSDGDRSLPGMRDEDYHLLAGERLGEVITRSWNRMSGAWESLRTAVSRLGQGVGGSPPGGRAGPGTSATRERWLLPLFSELGYGRLQTARGLEAGGTAYPVSHLWEAVPIHLVGTGVALDRRSAGVAGAARQSPHGLVQELLNRSDDHLWGIVSNGLVLRVLRDNLAMSRQAFVEFDLQAMMDGHIYADFVLLWLVCHQSRFEGDRPERCLVERWVEAAQKEGTRALETLRVGVERALTVLGTGFLAHPANTALRSRLSEPGGQLSREDLYRQLLRVVYRLLFLFVAEERDVLLLPSAEAEPGARERYDTYYSARRLRGLARHHTGTAHDDLWRTLSLVVTALGSDAGCPGLGLPGLGGQLFAPSATPDLSGALLRNDHLLEAVRALAWVERDRVVRAVDYRNLGAEELGSVYESLLELHPQVSVADRRFWLETGAGSERKTTGSYYTPASLITQLLDTALDPVLDRAAASANPETAILALTVIDPACGSGHFLVAAAHRIARRLATVRTGEGEPPPEAVGQALRDVVARCIHGVDVNPMALELAKVSLWLEAHVPGKPLTFLDHHLRCGNSLLGATPELIASGIPDGAFAAIEGDDKTLCGSYRSRNRALRSGQGSLLVTDSAPAYDALADRAAVLADMADDDVRGLHAKQQAFSALEGSAEHRHEHAIADAFCAAFTAVEAAEATEPQPFEVFYRLRDGGAGGPVPGLGGVAEEAARYRFFHWHLAFPDVFGKRDGFDVVLGNPPWEHTELKEKEFFATRDEEIANAPTGAARKRLIRQLDQRGDPLHDEFTAAKRMSDAISHFARNSGRYPLCGMGRINTYALFAELNRQNLAPTGRAGFIVPTGIATDHTTRHFFAGLVETGTLHSVFGFENEDRIFPGIHHAMKFTLLTLLGADDAADRIEFFVRARQATDLADPDRRYGLGSRDIALINPNTLTAPVFLSRRDAEITAAIYRRVPVLIREGDPDGNPWGLSFMQGLFNMTSASSLFRTRDELQPDERYLPLYEAKMVHHYDHRFGTYEGQTQAQANQGKLPEPTDTHKADPHFTTLPRYWVPEGEVHARLADRWPHEWLLGWRDIARSTDARTLITSVIPLAGVGDKYLLALPLAVPPGGLSANFASFILDYVARQKLGGTSLKYFTFKQLPVLPPTTYGIPTPWDPSLTLADWIALRHVELTYTAWDLQPFAADVGFDGPPFRWEPERRFLLRAELDAAFFHLYGLDRDEVDYVMDTFPIVRRKDEKAHGRYRTKDTILDVYDDMAKAITAGNPYATRLDPPPAHDSLRHRER